MSAPRIIDDWVTALRALRWNWNSYGAPPITEAAIEAMANFYVVPASDGGIQLEAHFGGKDFELEISPEGKMKAMFLSDTQSIGSKDPASEGGSE